MYNLIVDAWEPIVNASSSIHGEIPIIYYKQKIYRIGGRYSLANGIEIFDIPTNTFYNSQDASSLTNQIEQYNNYFSEISNFLERQKSHWKTILCVKPMWF